MSSRTSTQQETRQHHSGPTFESTYRSLKIYVVYGMTMTQRLAHIRCVKRMTWSFFALRSAFSWWPLARSLNSDMNYILKSGLVICRFHFLPWFMNKASSAPQPINRFFSIGYFLAIPHCNSPRPPRPGSIPRFFSNRRVLQRSGTARLGHH